MSESGIASRYPLLLPSLLSGVLNEVSALLLLLVFVVGRRIGYGELFLFVTVITEVVYDEILGRALYLNHISFITFATVSCNIRIMSDRDNLIIGYKGLPELTMDDLDGR